MIQDIAPSILRNAYEKNTPREDDYVLFFDENGKILTSIRHGEVRFLTEGEMPVKETIYLFAVDEKRYFLAEEVAECPSVEFAYRSLHELRDACTGTGLFAAFTAFHLWRWYRDNRYCGRCKGTLSLHDTERALRCKACGNVIYPRINPAVIVGVKKGDSLLITRYRNGYAHNALVAGFTEIGETLEQTVEREVMEETGVKVKNIRYYKSQPWGTAQDILTGFFCEADGDGEIRMDENELQYAEWVKREDIVLQPQPFSLTNEMMKLFKEGLES